MKCYEAVEKFEKQNLIRRDRYDTAQRIKKADEWVRVNQLENIKERMRQIDEFVYYYLK